MTHFLANNFLGAGDGKVSNNETNLRAPLLWAACLGAFLFFLSGCTAKENPDVYNAPEILERAPEVHPGPFWSAFVVYRDGPNETRYGVGPYLSQEACDAGLRMHVSNILLDGSRLCLAQCVASNEAGQPTENIDGVNCEKDAI